MLTNVQPEPDPAPCGENTKCSNNVGSFTCACLEGFTGAPPENPCTGKFYLIFSDILKNKGVSFVIPEQSFFNSEMCPPSLDTWLQETVGFIKNASKYTLLSF